MAREDQNLFDEYLKRAPFGDDQEATGRSLDLGGGNPNSFGGPFNHAQSNTMTASHGSSCLASQTAGTSLTSATPEYGTSSGITVRHDPQPVSPELNVGALSHIGEALGQISQQTMDHAALDREMQRLSAGGMSAPWQAPLFGIAGYDTRTGSPGLEELRMEVGCLNAELHAPNAEALFKQDRERMLYCVQQFRSRVAETKTKPKTIPKTKPKPKLKPKPKKDSRNRISKPLAAKREFKGKSKKKPFQCYECDTEFGTVGALQRHIEDQHYPCVSIRCPEPGCEEVSRRRDKARDHCLMKHQWKPSNEQLALYTQPRACPLLCFICSLPVSDWKEFYRCFIYTHCGMDTGTSDEGSSSDDDHGNGKGPAAGNDSGLPWFGMEGAGNSFGNGYSYCAGSSTHDFGSFNSMQNYSQNPNQNAHGMQRSSSDTNSIIPSQSDAYHDTSQKRRASFQDHSDLPREAQQPGLQQNRLLKQHKQARAEPLEDRICQKCNHKISGCIWCANRPISGEPCHECDDAMRIQASASSSQVVRHTGPIQGRMNPRVNLTPNQPQLGHLQRPQVPRPFGTADHQGPWQHGGYRQLTGNPQGHPRGPYNTFTTNVAFTYVHDLSEAEMLSAGSKSNASLGCAWLSCLPMRIPMGRMIKVPQTATALEYGVGSGAIDQIISQTISETVTPQINLPMAKLEAISPLLCRCPCRTKTAGPTYTSNARIELVPGKLLDMTLTILPEDRVGHPLRTRIRVVVKLLKLRSSVARSGNKKKNKQDAKEIELALKTSLYGSAPTRPVESKEETVAADESDMSEYEYDGLFSDAESVTSSVAEASSVSELALVPFERINSNMLFPNEQKEDNHDTSDLFSGSQFPDDDTEEIPHPNDPNPDDLVDEMQSLSLVDTNQFKIQETEFEISLDLDLHTCLDNLSNWTDGLADIERSGHITDPVRVFEMFFRYIIYVIFVLNRSRIEAAGR
ncbi:hypothetical protein N7494_007741 [Penicillium frequentans]|uniref:C2H2-type domain-containing protein n=1 Tax=Penicillium frequentans TaxID=3151616 RepID=A0AAD6CT28_9EURO|nr:hypothetical protein N7494_007741 [Penicillium glabrum]